MAFGVVKFYSAAKGYGFVIRDDGLEVFFHELALLDSEFDILRGGERVAFDLERDDSGRPRALNLRPDDRPPGAPDAYGAVKWFNPEKGFGFIERDGSRDWFYVHVSAVEAAGLDALAPAQRLGFDIYTDPVKHKTRAVNLRPVP